MSDGTTGIQVAPIPTESEMASIRQIFTNVANALVRASELAKQVEDLEARFTSLNEDHTRVMARSDQLEQSLSEARSQRDEALANANQLATDLTAKSQAFDNSQRHVDAMQGQIDDYQRQVASLRADNAHIADEWSKEMERAEKAEAVLAKLKAAMGIVDPPKLAEVAPQAEPISQATPESYMVNEGPAINPEPRPLSQEEATQPQSWDPTRF